MTGILADRYLRSVLITALTLVIAGQGEPYSPGPVIRRSSRKDRAAW